MPNRAYGKNVQMLQDANLFFRKFQNFRDKKSPPTKMMAGISIRYGERVVKLKNSSSMSPNNRIIGISTMLNTERMMIQPTSKLPESRSLSGSITACSYLKQHTTSRIFVIAAHVEAIP
jgi:hypothetical protein